MELTFLGTSSMIPTKERNPTGIFLRFDNKGFLFDCGEGTQRQMSFAGIKRNLINYVFITHWHGDHVGGLVSLLQSIGNLQSKEELKKIKLYGPKGTKEHFNHLLKMCIFESKVDIDIKEIIPEENEELVVIDTKRFKVTAVKLDHTAPCIGYSFYIKDKRRISKKKLKELNIREGPHLQKILDGKKIIYNNKTIKPEDITYIVKGKKISFVFDTKLCNGCDILAKDADILICEATHLEEIKEKAIKYKHMTALQAAQLASRNNVKKLYLTHFSQRYKTTEKIEEEARTVFPDAICAYDFLKIRKF